MSVKRLLKRRIWSFFVPIAIVGWMILIINEWLRQNLPYSLIPFILALTLWIVWFVKGNVIFCPWKWSRHETIEVEEIEVPEDKLDRILGALKPERRILDIKGKIVKRKINKEE